MLDYHVILDMLPTIAFLYFTGRLKGHVKPSRVQTALLVAIGLQHKEFSDLERELDLNTSQLMAMFVKVIRKVSTAFSNVVKGAVEETMPERMEVDENGVHGDVAGGAEQRFRPLEKDLDEELREGGDEFQQAERERAKALIDALPLDRYAYTTPQSYVSRD
jgi:N-acetyltransferase 10